MTDRRKLLARDRPGGEERSGQIEVLIGLERDADQEILGRLRNAFGVQVTSVIGDTVVGAMPGEKLARLRNAPGVRDVETSRPVRPHRKLTR